MPYQEAVSGELATAAYVNEFFLDQAVCRFSSEAQRDAEILTPVIGQVCIVTNNMAIYVYNGSQWTRHDTQWFGYTPTLYASTSGAVSPAYVTMQGWYKQDHIVHHVIIEGSVVQQYVGISGTFAVSLPPAVAAATPNNFSGSGQYRQGSLESDFYAFHPRYVAGDRIGAWMLDHTLGAANVTPEFWDQSRPSTGLAGHTFRFDIQIRGTDAT